MLRIAVSQTLQVIYKVLKLVNNLYLKINEPSGTTLNPRLQTKHLVYPLIICLPLQNISCCTEVICVLVAIFISSDINLASMILNKER